ncbi:MAG TPA: hypothetical protein VNA16_09345 [Abditibacteriaceae bacterium]|nr:hypothetical protein [Abditibacteriaceae bacterium]
MNWHNTRSLAVLLLLCLSQITMAQTAGTSGANDLVIARGGATQATIVIVPEAGKQTVAIVVRRLEPEAVVGLVEMLKEIDEEGWLRRLLGDMPDTDEGRF